MSTETPIIIAFIYIFLMMNLYGWGLLKDERFVVFGIATGLLYLLFDLFYFFTKNSRWVNFKLFLLLLYIGVAVFGATASFMYLRNIIHPVGLINDSALQTEISGRFLLLGKNPYTESFVNTDLSGWPYKDEADNKVNPALFQNVHPPFLIVLSGFGFRIFSQLLGWFDIRVFFLTAYLAVLILGWLKFKRKHKFLLFLGLVALNPLFLNAMMEGTNDIFVLAFILWSLYFLEKKKFSLSGGFLGLAGAMKQTAWFIFPFYFFYAWQNLKKANLKTFALVWLAVMVIFYLPFALWNLPALMSSLIFYASAAPRLGLPIHPIEGYGFGRLLLKIGLLDSIYAPYPFWLYQVGLGLPLIGLLLWLQKRKMTLTGLLYSYTIFLATVWFFNRYFLTSHLAFIMVLAGATYVYEKA